MLKIRSSGFRGITLIELLVVVAIIGTIAAISVPAYQGYLSSARAREAQMALRMIASSQESYRLANGGYATISSNCSDSSAGQCNCSNPVSTAADSCEPSAATSANLANCMLRGTLLNTTYYQFCTFANNTVVPPIYTAVATETSTSTRLSLNQNGTTSGF
jgi:prepilin-type N-terminal cleavage/methylation domain-containing protein